jgi:hypothetical protein
MHFIFSIYEFIFVCTSAETVFKYIDIYIYMFLGMKRSSIRRVELPSQLVFRAREDKQLPLPSEKNEEGKRYYKRLFKTDATLLFEVLVTKIAEPIAK